MPEMQAWRAAGWVMCSLVLLAHCLGKNCRRMMQRARGCVAHGTAADVLAARFGTRGMLATDLFSTLQRIVNPEVTDKNHDESSNSAP